MWVLWSPFGGLPRVLKQGLVKLVALFAEVPDCVWEIPGAIRKNPGEFITARSAEIFRFKFDLIKTGIEFRQRIPLGRMGRPDEVARVALVLASDLASYVHGASIPIDGGFLSA